MFCDADRYTDGGLLKRIFAVLIDPGLQACVSYRLGHWLDGHGMRLLALLVWRRAYRKTGADIRPSAVIGKGLVLPHPFGVVIGAHARIGERCTLYDGVTLGIKSRDASTDGQDAYPTLGDDVILYTGAKVLGGVSIGDRAVIGANAVVLTPIEDDAVAVGVPARVLPRRDYDD